jgi:hypothetical protein
VRRQERAEEGDAGPFPQPVVVSKILGVVWDRDEDEDREKIL